MWNFIIAFTGVDFFQAFVIITSSQNTIGYRVTCGLVLVLMKVVVPKPHLLVSTTFIIGSFRPTWIDPKSIYQLPLFPHLDRHTPLCSEFPHPYLPLNSHLRWKNIWLLWLTSSSDNLNGVVYSHWPDPSLLFLDILSCCCRSQLSLFWFRYFPDRQSWTLPNLCYNSHGWNLELLLP